MWGGGCHKNISFRPAGTTCADSTLCLRGVAPPSVSEVKVAVALASIALALSKSHRPRIAYEEMVRSREGEGGGVNNKLRVSNPFGKAANAQSNPSQHVLLRGQILGFSHDVSL